MLFACIFVPDFPAAAIVRNEPDLRGHAVAVVEGTPPLLNVVAANEAARRAGVEVGMTKLQAEARLAHSHLCRNPAGTGLQVQQGASTIRRRSEAQEAVAHAALGDCAHAISPRVEEPAETPDVVLLDVAGLERLFGSPQTVALELARRASEVGLDANVAVCSNLDAAMCAARGFAGVSVIADEQIAERLGGLLLDVVMQAASFPGAVAQEFVDTFDRWGVRTCRAFAALPEVAVSERLGTQGVYLQKLARGEGTRTLAPTEPAPDFEEAIELEYPIEDMESLAFVLNRLIEQVCARLSARALSTNELRLRMGLEEGRHGFTRINTDSISAATNKNSIPTGRYERTIRLPVPMTDARTFLRLWQLELRANPPRAAIERMWLRAEAVEPRFTQNGLFLPTAPEPERLEITLARIAGVIRGNGDNSELRVGSPEVLDTHAPDAFRMKRFVATAGSTPTIRNPEDATRTSTVLRRMRPPIRVKVEMQEGRPARVWGVTCDGTVQWCAGPWRISGEWWKDVWGREEWDVALDAGAGNMFWRLYRDASDQWFMEGAYD